MNKISNPAIDVATILENNGIGEIGKDIFVTSDVPSKPDFIVFITTTGVSEPESPQIPYSFPTIQVITRGNIGKYVECSDKMYEINALLHGMTDVIVNSMRYVYIYNAFGPLDMGLDDTRRPMIATNFNARRGFWPYLGSDIEAVASVFGNLKVT